MAGVNLSRHTLRGRWADAPSSILKFTNLKRREDKVRSIGHGTSSPVNPEVAIARANGLQPAAGTVIIGCNASGVATFCVHFLRTGYHIDLERYGNKGRARFTPGTSAAVHQPRLLRVQPKLQRRERPPWNAGRLRRAETGSLPGPVRGLPFQRG